MAIVIVGNLSTAFPGLDSSIQDFNNAVNKFQGNAAKIKDKGDEIFAAANIAVDSCQTLLSALGASGAYIAPPQIITGSWTNALTSAEPTPIPDTGINVVFTVVFHVPDPNAATQALNNLLAALNTSVEIPKLTIPTIP